MRETLTRLLAITALALCGGCDPGSEKPPDLGDPPDPPNSSCGAPDPTLATRDASELYSSATLPTFDFWLPPERWDSLQRNARDEQYTSVEACFEGKSLGTVGLRFKGSYGSLLSCFDEQGQRTCSKLPLKVKFDEYVPGQRFFQQKRLNFHSMRWDNTHLRERLAYDLYRAMEVDAPRSSWAMVRVNGNVEGLFSMVEQIDGRFTDARFTGGGDGNLYKEAWPTSLDPGYYQERLDTNEETGSPDNVVALAGDLAATSAPERLAALGRSSDLDYLYRYMAVDDALANYDGITTFYVAEDRSWSGNHNFYLYEEEERPYFWLIPWDLESTFNINPLFESVPRWTETPEDCDAAYPVWGDSQVLAPGCDPLLSALASDLTPYQLAVQQLLEGPFGEDALIQQIDQHAAFLREGIRADPNGPTELTWQSEIAWLKSQLPLLRARLDRFGRGLSGGQLSLSTTEVNDFEAVDDFGLFSGATLASNETSSVSASVNRVDPINASASILLGFDYRNDSIAWGQWIYFALPLRTSDLSALTGVRLLARADRPRTLRLGIESPNDTLASQGIHFGWDVPVSATTTLIEVHLRDAAVPSWAKDQGLDPEDDLPEILANVRALFLNPSCEGRNLDGFLPDGATDAGQLEIDDIEFF